MAGVSVARTFHPLFRCRCALHDLVMFQHTFEAQGYDHVYLPTALADKFSGIFPIGWYWVFPSSTLSIDPRSGRKQRHHMHPTTLQRAVRTAIRKAGIPKHALCHTFRYSFATHLPESGRYQLQEVQQLLGHTDIKTTKIYLHVIHQKENPLDW